MVDLSIGLGTRDNHIQKLAFDRRVKSPNKLPIKYYKFNAVFKSTIH